MEKHVALITGAARGIGLATTKLLLERGWNVAMVDRDGPELRAASQDLEGAIAFEFDISVPEQVETMTKEVLSEFGGINAVVNNAGVADFGPIEQTDFARWREVMATNLDGVFLCSQAATPALKESRGCIVNIASLAGMIFTPSCYSWALRCLFGEVLKQVEADPPVLVLAQFQLVSVRCSPCVDKALKPQRVIEVR